MTLLYIYLWGIIPSAISLYDVVPSYTRKQSLVAGIFWPVLVSIALFDKIFE